ncbi:ABC transporter permease [Microbacterium paraoxydans]|uniref:Polyketide antibiotic transporter n=1 Tax=Microbacterium paraoxydans TaxID=199592 RepID=A0ABS5II75_9MICO|nr:polyketide antibiotic transporter [Microbacterium paraoxydans]MBS0022672.1 polyketide antibiotic transporter [Microbacterium paraoxydans]
MDRFGVLVRQRIRRDRVQVPLWIVGTALMAFAGYAGVTQSYATVADRQNILAAALANPVILMFRGLPSGTSEGAFLAFEVLPWLALLAALMSVFLAVRHTRGDEEAGRTELVWATPAGRRLPTIATAVHGIAANLVLAALTALALMATGLDAGGSVLAGAAAGSCGLAFLGIALFTAQLFRTSRGANSAAVWVLVAAFLLRGIGNAAGTPADDLAGITSAWPAWLSPFGWAEQTRPFDENLWWPPLLGLALGLALAAAAVGLQALRDVDAGFVAERLGRVAARPGLSSPLALVWRLTSGGIVGWAVGGALTGLLATTLGGVVDRIAGENPAVTDILEKIGGATGGLEEVVVTVFFTLLGILVACCAVQTVVRARQEEARGTVELVLATPTGRVRWLADHLIVGAVAVLLVVAAAVLGGWLGVRSSDGDTALYRIVAVAGAGQALAGAVFVALTALVFVVLPRATIPVAWVLVLVAALLGMFGPLFGLPEWTANLSPFAVTPVMDRDGVDVRGLWWLVLVVAGATAGALTLMRRRELAAGG